MTKKQILHAAWGIHKCVKKELTYNGACIFFDHLQSETKESLVQTYERTTQGQEYKIAHFGPGPN